jgi:hypothetical protein
MLDLQRRIGFSVPSMPTRQSATNGLADLLGAPVDSVNWIARKVGLPSSPNMAVGSDYLRNAFDGLTNEELLRAMFNASHPRGGLF